MANDWILDVLSDLQRFADLNGMPELSDKLGSATESASREIRLDCSASSIEKTGLGAHAATGQIKVYAVAAGRDG